MSVLAVIQINIEIMLAILCVAIWILTKVWEKDNKQPYRFIWIIDLLTAGLLVSDVLAITYRGNVSSTGYYMVRGANFFNFAFLYAMVMYTSFLVDYIFEYPKQLKSKLLATKILSGFALGVVFINLFVPIMYSFDENNKYFRLNGWYFTSTCVLASVFLLSISVIEMRKEVDQGVFLVLLTEILMPFIASVIQIFIYGISITNIAIGITQIILFMIMYRYQEMRIKERDVLLDEYNAKLILTQVQPHFMLNTLSTIQYLCKFDNQAAIETISDLGIYLRNNMDFASTNEMIPFGKELEHVEKYISIEQKRFMDRINIKYDIQVKDFDIPPLSVQPLVENAIKHGITKKKNGGTIELSTWRGVDEIHIIVKDDGKGFDTTKPLSDDRVHLGIDIVTKRLKRMCNGSVKLESTPGVGTICEITIPIEFK